MRKVQMPVSKIQFIAPISRLVLSRILSGVLGAQLTINRTRSGVPGIMVEEKSNEVFQEDKKVPRVLYHYTSAQGLLGILESNSLRASDLHFMNDFSELKYATELINNELVRAAKEHIADLLPQFLSKPFRAYIIDEFTAYAVCFCEKEDQLSQWRAYAGHGTGYALGFDLNQIENIQAGDSQTILQKVVYDRERQLNLLKEPIKEYIDNFRTTNNNASGFSEDQRQKHLSNSFDNFLGSTCTFPLFFKNQAFEEEKEWRMVVIKHLSDMEHLEFRELRSTIVPYINM
jgi:hypothetical protein